MAMAGACVLQHSTAQHSTADSGSSGRLLPAARLLGEMLWNITKTWYR
mgnify:CR=1 FL=1